MSAELAGASAAMATALLHFIWQGALIVAVLALAQPWLARCGP